MFFLVALPLLVPASVLRDDPVQAAPATAEALLFSRTMVVGHDISDGKGLEKELGAPGSLTDVVTASLLFQPKAPVEGRTFAETSVAAQQIQAAIDGQATLVIAVDYLIPYVYGAQNGDEARAQQVSAALKALEPLHCTIVLGDVPDLRPALGVEKPVLGEQQVPSAAALKALNDSVMAWAQAHRDVVVAPVSMVFAHVQQNEAFVVHQYTWGQSWLPELLQTDRVHTRLHGSIAVWLAGLDALCTARKDLDPTAFDWNALSIYKKVYAAKSKQREAAVELETARLRLPPSRPPPQPPKPGPPPDESSKNPGRRKAGGNPNVSGKSGG